MIVASGANTRAYYRGLRQRTERAGRLAAADAAREARDHARETDGSGLHHGGWRDDSETLSKSIRAVKDQARSGRTVFVWVVFSTVFYAAYVERLGYWVVTGLSLRARKAYVHHFRRRFSELLD